jgi:hypothetical protein
MKDESLKYEEVSTLPNNFKMKVLFGEREIMKHKIRPRTISVPSLSFENIQSQKQYSISKYPF